MHTKYYRKRKGSRRRSEGRKEGRKEEWMNYRLRQRPSDDPGIQWSLKSLVHVNRVSPAVHQCALSYFTKCTCYFYSFTAKSKCHLYYRWGCLLRWGQHLSSGQQLEVHCYDTRIAIMDNRHYQLISVRNGIGHHWTSKAIALSEALSPHHLTDLGSMALYSWLSQFPKQSDY
jgi:hypothetical protein